MTPQEEMQKDETRRGAFVSVFQDVFHGILKILLWLGVFTMQIIIMAFILGSVVLAVVGTGELLSAIANLSKSITSAIPVMSWSVVSQEFTEMIILSVEHYIFSLLLFFFAIILYSVVIRNIKFMDLRFTDLGDVENKLKEYLFAILASTLVIVALGKIMAGLDALASSIGAGVLIMAMSIYLFILSKIAKSS